MVAIVAVVLLAPLGNRIRRGMTKRSRPVPTAASPTLAVQLDETWFVTFTSGPYPASPDGREQYVTAIAAVDRVDGEHVALRWRDTGSFPSSVPIKLLEATQVYRFRDDGDARRRVRVQNEGLRAQGPGGIVTGWGWRAHRRSPHGIVFARYEALSPVDKKAMEADADLDSYDLKSL